MAAWIIQSVRNYNRAGTGMRFIYATADIVIWSGLAGMVTTGIIAGRGNIVTIPIAVLYMIGHAAWIISTIRNAPQHHYRKARLHK